MASYHVLRFLCALAAIGLAARIHRFRLGALFTFSAYLAAESISLLIPAQLDDPAWWRICWTPIAAIRVGLLVAVSLDVFSFLRPRTLPGERSAILVFATAGGFLCVVSGWYWVPENWFQGFAVIRQYAILLIAVAVSLGWWYVRVRRPVPMSDMLRDHGAYWCIWCWTGFLAATTVKGGLLWLLVQWKGGVDWWFVWSVSALGLQLVLVLSWWISLPDLRLRSIDSGAGRSLPASRA